MSFRLSRPFSGDAQELATHVRKLIANNVVHKASRKQKRDEFYNLSEEIIRDDFTSLDVTSHMAVCRAVMLVYSWMTPTGTPAGPFSSQRFEKISPILQRIRKGGFVSSQELTAIVSFFDGSTVGASKFLHFLAPERFAIWDRNVAIGYGLVKPGEHRHDIIKRTDNYAAYLEDIRDWAETLPQEQVSQLAALRNRDASAPLRSLEFAVFMFGKYRVANIRGHEA